MVSDSNASRPRRRLDMSAVRRAVADFWITYRWPVKLVFALVIASSLVGVALAAWPELNEESPRWLLAFTSDATRTLLTFVIALFIAINFHMRARKGVLDGDEHYNVARALAFGYFKNFLVPALQRAEQDGRLLHVLRPGSLRDMHTYSREIEPRLKAIFQQTWLPVVEQPIPGGTPRRTVLALQAPPSSPASGAEPFFFDVPTALFTVNDFYAAMNRRLEEQGKEPIAAEVLVEYQNGQIDSFFQHLEFLFRTSPGFAAVKDIVASTSELNGLHTLLRLVTVGDLNHQYPG